MSNKTGLWIDHRKAVIVKISDKSEATSTIESDVERHGRYHGGPERDPEDTRDRRFAGELDKYYDEVIADIRDAEAILIFGPGEAKGELRTRLEQAKLADRIVAVESADKMTDREVAAHVRQRFAGGKA